MLTSPLGNGQTRFFGEDGKASIGTYKRLPQVNAGILSIVSEDKVFEEVYNLQDRNILIMTIALCIALAGIFLFAKTISLPILELLKATGEIEKGKFDITLKASTQDEVGLLTKSFARMGKGLKERERIKDALGRFVNPAIAELALSKELKLGGENKMCTIFFSDIRGFTAMSEKLSPEEIVELLNQYFTRMVECIDLTFGIVDKFIGDAIMATWGTLDAVGNSFENGINAALMMRSMLVDFNRSRGTDEKRPIIRMGCGLNYGAVVAGQIGSENRLDYTVIGDAVNLASRIESLNKPFGTDILISEDLYKEVEGVYLVEKMKQIMVKGKSEPQTIYAVIRRMDDTDSDAPQTLADIRKLLKIDFDEDKYNSGNPEEEEKKYKVLDSAKTNLPEQDVVPVKQKKQRAKQ
jgi:adenylate cyclase